MARLWVKSVDNGLGFVDAKLVPMFAAIVGDGVQDFLPSDDISQDCAVICKDDCRYLYVTN
jgi:hypothetical protein